MPAADAPTRPRGTLGTGQYLSGWGAAVDQLEHVPDLVWPVSIRTYARMRHDPTITSVLAGYRLPLLAARWEIDPRGASPDLVRICADSLDLPVRGEPDDPGPVRRRGVRWRQHLRSALGMLTFGHAPFEPVYEIRDGRAYLASLGERLPTSIADIRVNDQGDLIEIEQYGDVTQPNPAPIPADRLLWYVHDREGANWAGVSILRASFGPWLFKQDALRVGGTSLRRWGAGIPTVEWDPGIVPTAEQQRAAQAAASAARAGETASVVMPPGAHLVVKGVEGTFPDAMPQVNYHDQQMARSCLSSMLDLGNTANGSRALGQSFAELLALAQQSLAEQVAETATELCVRLTDFNAGEDAESPAVAVGMIGDDEQALAQSIAQLVQAGAVQVDDELEDWLRQAFRAPARTKPRTQPPAPPAPGVQPAGPPDPEAKQDQQQDGGQDAKGTGKVAARRVAAAGADPAATDPATTTGVASRPLTADELAAGLDPQEVDDEHAAVLAMLLAAWLLIRRKQRDDVVAEVERLLTKGGVSDLTGLAVDTADAATTLGAAMLYGADAGVRVATAEAARQGVTVTGAVVDSAGLEATATALADALGHATTAAAQQQAVALSASGMAPADVAAGVGQWLDQLPPGWSEDQVAGAVWTGMGAGRAAVYTISPPAVLVASEILDRATCRQVPPDPVKRCWEVDGTRYETLAAALEDYPAGRYRACKGGVRCRGQVLAIHQVPGSEG